MRPPKNPYPPIVRVVGNRNSRQLLVNAVSKARNPTVLVSTHCQLALPILGRLPGSNPTNFLNSPDPMKK